MKLAWVTPLVQPSAIGRESVAVCEALAARGHDVTLVGSEAAAPAPQDLRATALPRLHWSEPGFADTLARAELVVVAIGDNYPYHAGAFAALERVPCLGVFHDFYLHNLFNGWIHAMGLPQEVRSRHILDTYGEAAADIAASPYPDQFELADLARRAPMTEWFARRCVGALAHADFYLPRLQDCPGPIDVAALPVAPRGVRALPRRTRPYLTAITVGVMNPNKCADRVIEAVAGSPALHDRLRYRLVGPISPEERARLESLARRRGYKGLTITGPVDDAQLTRELDAADIVCCLRQPVLEGASGSAIEGLLSGRPVVVADAGFYGGLPDDLVTKVEPDLPLKAIARALERLAPDEMARRTQGAAARRWAAATFTTERYVDVLEGLMPATQATPPLLNAARGLGLELAALDLGPDDPAVARLSATLDGLFGEGAA